MNTAISNPHRANLNLQPAHLAAQWVEQGLLNLSAIILQPAEGMPGEQTREILEVRHLDRRKEVVIQTRTKSQDRSRIESALFSNKESKAFLTVLEQEIGRFRITLALRERTHFLEMSPLQEGYYPEIQRWEADHRRILAFLLPYRALLREDLQLVAMALKTALRQPVSMEFSAAKEEQPRCAQVDQCTLDSGAKVGGVSASPRSCLRILIGPISLVELTHYAPGGRQRRFLEEVLLPLVLPPDYDWQLDIQVEKEHRGLRIGSGQQPSRLGINSWIPDF